MGDTLMGDTLMGDTLMGDTLMALRQYTIGHNTLMGDDWAMEIWHPDTPGKPAYLVSERKGRSPYQFHVLRSDKTKAKLKDYSNWIIPGRCQPVVTAC
jgi:hypothetical protein